MTAGSHRAPPADPDRLVGRILTIGTYTSILLLAVGSVLMFGARIDPPAGGAVRAGPDRRRHHPPPAGRLQGLGQCVACHADPPGDRVVLRLRRPRRADHGRGRRPDPRGHRRERHPRQQRSLIAPVDIVILIGALFIILLGAELFTNGIEWFGRKLQLAEGAVGSVLAAVGTALPETMIPIIAILAGGGSRRPTASASGRSSAPCSCWRRSRCS